MSNIWIFVISHVCSFSQPAGRPDTYELFYLIAVSVTLSRGRGVGLGGGGGEDHKGSVKQSLLASFSHAF